MGLPRVFVSRGESPVVRPPLALLVAFLLATAGCSAVLGPSSEPATPGTPVPVESPEPPPDAPGLTLSGIEKPFVLADAHGSVLWNTSYRVERVSELRLANDTLLLQVTERVAMSGQDGRYRYTVESAGLANYGYRGREVRYGNGSALFVLRTGEDGRSVDVPRNPDGSPVDPETIYHGDPTNRGTLASYLAQAEGVTVSPAAGDDYRVRATRFSGNSLSTRAGIVRNVTVEEFVAVVTPRGVVREYRLDYEGTLDGRQVTGTEVVRYAEIGEPTVERPDWATAAGNETATEASDASTSTIRPSDR
jgi:hypothetical protein